MNYDRNRALELLRQGAGRHDAEFRPSQEAAIQHLVTRAPGRLLVVQKTGWGKSFVYFIAAKLIQENGGGPTLLISPLLALMRDQQIAAQQMGVVALAANSTNREEWPDIAQKIASSEIGVLMFHPKQLTNQDFQNTLLSSIAGNVSMVVVDEAHCISDWGHDFVPEYKLVSRLIKALPPNIPMLATTATANNRVLEDLNSILGPNLVVTRGTLHRPSITLQTITFESDAERLAWLANALPSMPGSGIIYALTKAHVEYIVAWLRVFKISVAGYSSNAPDRGVLEQKLRDNEIKVLVSTSALGMGYDKPDLTFVIHYQPPGSVVAYYQQVGRAGRAIDDARGIVLAVRSQRDVNSYFIESAFPTLDEIAAVMSALHATGDRGLKVGELLDCVNLRKSRIEKAITALSIESPAPIIRDGSYWKVTGTPVASSFYETAHKVTKLRRNEHEQMQDYMRLQTGHMEFLVHALDGDPSTVTPARQRPLYPVPSPQLVTAADTFMKNQSLRIKPRARWPDGGLTNYGIPGSTNIRMEHRANGGLALSMWGAAGWAEVVRQARYERGHFGDDLVQACAALIGRLGLFPTPTWVTCVPSLGSPELVPDFSRRLATALGLPFHQALLKTRATQAQKSMHNSSQQAKNLDGSMAFVDFPAKAGPVLLVDDIVNSGWTFTIAAWILRSNGCGEVWPLALAKTGSEE